MGNFRHQHHGPAPSRRARGALRNGTRARCRQGTSWYGVLRRVHDFLDLLFETVRMLEEERIFEAVGNVVVSVAVGLAAAAVELALGLSL